MLWQTFSMAFKAIRTNKVRAALTMLGVIIGVMSVVVLIAIGQGTTARVTDSIQNMGTNLLTVNITNRRVGQFGGGNSNRNQGGGGERQTVTMIAQPGGAPQMFIGGGQQSSGQQRGTVVLTLDDILSLTESPDIEMVSPTVNGNKTIKAGNNNTSTTVMGVLPQYAHIRNQAVQAGRYIIQADVDNRSAVCVIGVDTAEELYGNSDVVGNVLSIEGRRFTIVGVLESKGSSGGSSSDDIVILPYTLAQRMLQSTSISTFYVSAPTAEQVTSAQTYVENYLYKRYQNTSAYRVSNQTEMLDTIGETTAQLTLMLGGIAGIALLVGGIGIMNIMLVSVSERTREIGIRKAIGARRRDILLQFLIEAVVISGLGGLMGLLLGWLLMQVLHVMLDMPLVMSTSVVQLAIGFSMAVGVGFGLYPAGKASKLKPIDALRSE